MPKYFFHIIRGGVWEKDPEGIEFPTLEAAYGDARQAAQEMIVDQILSSRPPIVQRLVITAESGEVLEVLSLGVADLTPNFFTPAT